MSSVLHGFLRGDNNIPIVAWRYPVLHCTVGNLISFRVGIRLRQLHRDP